MLSHLNKQSIRMVSAVPKKREKSKHHKKSTTCQLDYGVTGQTYILHLFWADTGCNNRKVSTDFFTAHWAFISNHMMKPEPEAHQKLTRSFSWWSLRPETQALIWKLHNSAHQRELRETPRFCSSSQRYLDPARYFTGPSEFCEFIFLLPSCHFASWQGPTYLPSLQTNAWSLHVLFTFKAAPSLARRRL